jgi:hypothetical protein
MSTGAGYSLEVEVRSNEPVPPQPQHSTNTRPSMMEALEDYRRLALKAEVARQTAGTRWTLTAVGDEAALCGHC